jgi:hypothetical protein
MGPRGFWEVKGGFTHTMPIPCRSHVVSLPLFFHAVLLPCRSAKGLDCVFPIWFCTMRPRWIHTSHGVVGVNRPYVWIKHGRIVQNQMGKPLAERHDRGTAGERHGTCESALRLPYSVTSALEGGMLTALRTGLLYPQEYPSTHFKRLSRPRAHGIFGCHGKIPIDTNVNWSLDLPTSSVVP